MSRTTCTQNCLYSIQSRTTCILSSLELPVFYLVKDYLYSIQSRTTSILSSLGLPVFYLVQDYLYSIQFRTTCEFNSHYKIALAPDAVNCCSTLELVTLTTLNIKIFKHAGRGYKLTPPPLPNSHGIRIYDSGPEFWQKIMRTFSKLSASRIDMQDAH